MKKKNKEIIIFICVMVLPFLFLLFLIYSDKKIQPQTVYIKNYDIKSGVEIKWPDGTTTKIKPVKEK